MAENRIPESVLDYTRQLKKKYSDLKKVYLFGSHLKGTDTEDSDIDIAFVFEDVNDTIDLQVQLMKLRRNYETRIEPHVFKFSEFNSSNPMAVEIIKNSLEI